jgi:hypothetical protein
VASILDGELAVVRPAQVKAAFKCDAYFVDLSTEPASVVDQARYWFGLFSHRREGQWKGMLQVSLQCRVMMLMRPL